MKKKISYFVMVTLIACSLIMPCVADEATTDIVTDITTELVTDALTEPTESPTEPTVTEPTEDATEEAPAPTEDVAEPTVEDSVDEWEYFKAKITDSATWTMIGAAILTVLTTVGTVKSKFDKISSLMHTKTDNETFKSALRNVENTLKAAYNDNHKAIADTLKRYEENEQRLYAILTLFMTNCRISESAKAEILNILADVKKYDGDVSEFVAQAQEAIDKDVAEKEAQTPPTPNLDRLLDEDYMELG